MIKAMGREGCERAIFSTFPVVRCTIAHEAVARNSIKRRVVLGRSSWARTYRAFMTQQPLPQFTKRSRLHGLYCRPTSQVPLLRKETQNSPSVAFLLLSPPKASSTRLSFDRGP